MQLAELTHEEHAALEGIFGTIVEQNLIYIKSVTKQCEECSTLPTAKYWKVVLNQSYDILDKVIYFPTYLLSPRNMEPLQKVCFLKMFPYFPRDFCLK